MARAINTENRPGSEEAGTSEDGEPKLPTISVAERGRGSDGKPISLNRRLFMQFLAFGNCRDIDALKAQLDAANPQAVLYQDANDPFGVGLLVFSENPDVIMEIVQSLCSSALNDAEPKPEYTMFGRTYSIGYESDLEEVLVTRPVTRVCDPELPWSVWYPVRRSGMFERESNEEQRKMLMEHGGIGHAFGKAGLATDIRLAGHGLNKDDNDFIIGLLGKELFPLSALVQRMRRTRQTSEFIDAMGPFFVGRAVWQTQGDRELR